MARSAPIAFTIFFFVLLILASEMGPTVVTEAKECSTKSDRFRGTCFRSSNCAAVCNSENFPSGTCRGFPGTCYCTSNCAINAPITNPPPEVVEPPPEVVEPPPQVVESTTS
ncbi:putative defensin, plant [Lupinus albus]|uniref:Putative defensin, plant n=1 Tax=Lupinus albus TaxID=3870 RepID=A0A6A4NWF4_LUPAL|nr:putative defensin, plant [Lupinus albus]